MDKTQEQIGQILIKKGFIKAEQLEDALEEQKRTKEFLGAVLVRRKQVKEKELAGALSEKFNIPFISLKDMHLDWKFISGFSPSLILDYKCLPIKEDGLSVTVAITNPLDARVLKKAEDEAIGRKLKLVLVTEKDLKETIRRYQQHIRGKYL